MLTFITSLRHPQNSNSYPEVLRLLEASLRSICRQSDADFRVIVVCNERPQITFYNRKVEYVVVDFPPPSKVEGPRTGLEAMRKDRGCKYVVGLLAARVYAPDYVMFFDADDFVHKDIARHCNRNPGKGGWYIDEGYLYCDGSMLYSRFRSFYKYCGTCNIIDAQSIVLPGNLTQVSTVEEIEEFTDKNVLYRILGEHQFAVDYFSDQGSPLAPLPFAGAIYVVATGENHSGITWGSFVADMPKIIDKQLSDKFGMGLDVTAWRRLKALFVEYPIELRRLRRLKRRYRRQLADARQNKTPRRN